MSLPNDYHNITQHDDDDDDDDDDDIV